MNQSALPIREERAATYLQHLQALAFEISRAMECIAANALPGFRESVAHQETLCAHLATMTTTAMGGLQSSNPVLAFKIRETSTAIRELNLQYAALLKHAGKSVALLASLCRSYTGQFQEARGARLKHQTWSCEM